MAILWHEYERRNVALSADVVSDLVAAAGDRLTVQATSEPGTVPVTASSYVGTIVTTQAEVRVRPKVPIANLFLMLDVGLPPDAWRPEATLYGTARDLLPAIASFYARTLERTVAAGLLRSGPSGTAWSPRPHRPAGATPPAGHRDPDRLRVRGVHGRHR